MKSVTTLPDLTQARVSLVATLPAGSDCELAILVPGFDGLNPSLADLVGVLPVRNFNRMLLDAVTEGVPQTPLVLAGVLAVDPFLYGDVLYRPLAVGGVAGVVNLPSVAPADGDLQRALGMAGLGAERELRALAAAREHGLEPLAQVFSYAEAMRAAELGIRRMLLHPGFPSGDPRLDRKLAEAAGVTLQRLRRQGLDTLLYRHPSLDAVLPGGPEDAGQLVWRVPAPREHQPRL